MMEEGGELGCCGGWLSNGGRGVNEEGWEGIVGERREVNN
jgi:hypothetical protein